MKMVTINVCRAAMAIALGIPAAHGVCATGVTRIADTLVLADQATEMRGTITLRGPSAPSGGVVASTLRITIGNGGAVDFCLSGGPGWKYDATFALVDATGKPTDQFTERWIVPKTSVAMTREKLWGGSSAPQFLVSPQQINPAGLVAGQTWIWDGTSYGAGTTGGGGIDGTSTWAEIEAGTAGSGSIGGTTTWATIEQ
jgi:hypothetical protein